MYFLLGYLPKCVYGWARVCACLHSTVSTCTHSISQRANEQRVRAGILKRQLALCEDAAEGPIQKTHVRLPYVPANVCHFLYADGGDRRQQPTAMRSFFVLSFAKLPRFAVARGHSLVEIVRMEL